MFGGMHHEDSGWSNTTIPGHFCLANEEASFSYVPTIHSMKHFFRSKYNIEIEDCVSGVYTDKHPACKIVVETEFPSKPHILCSQHGKTNVSTEGSKR